MDDAALAENFPNTQAAIAEVIEKRLEDLELILQFGTEPSRIYDVSLPLFPAGEPLSPKSRKGEST
jgi:hypothetical protein